MSRLAPLMAAAAGVVLLLLDSYPVQQKPDAVTEAFETYEILWRDGAAKAAEQLEAGKLQTSAATRDFLSKANQLARREAFQALADAEQSKLEEWDAKTHAAILRGYQR